MSEAQARQHAETKDQPIPPADLPIDAENRIYHLQLKAGQIAPDILIVGDPGRARHIGATFFRDVELEHENRGLVTVTGTAEITGDRATIISPLKTTVATSGMGTSSLEIVINELVALYEIDLEKRLRKTEFLACTSCVGTSGTLQASTVPGTLIITSYAIGLDNTGLYYEAPYLDEHCGRLEHELRHFIQNSMSPNCAFLEKSTPMSRGPIQVWSRPWLEAAAHLQVPAKVGLTASCSGFFAPQGRDVARLKPTIPDLDRILSEFDPGIDGQRIQNMEMEASFLLHFANGLGHRAGTICTTIANRRSDAFDPHYQESVANAVRVALRALAALRKTG